MLELLLDVFLHYYREIGEKLTGEDSSACLEHVS